MQTAIRSIPENLQTISFPVTASCIIRIKPCSMKAVSYTQRDVYKRQGPISVEKAVTFKVIAVKNQMADSKVLTAGYTVREPVVVEEIEEEETPQDNSGTGRLQSRRNFSNAQAGPSFTDVVLDVYKRQTVHRCRRGQAFPSSR